MKQSRTVKKPLKKREKVKTAKWLKNRCDELWRSWVKREQVCFFRNAGLGDCKMGMYGFEAAHLIGRAQSARIMYHPMNGICLCTRCHMIFDNKIQGTLHHKAHCYLHENLPGRVEMLEDLARTKTPMKRYEWEATLEGLRRLGE